MFEDRTDRYDFKKYDKIVRTQVLTEEKTEQDTKEESLAHKKLFNYSTQQNNETEIQKKETPTLRPISETKFQSLPSTNYLKQFENQTIDEQSELAVQETENANKQQEIDYKSLIESAENVEVENLSLKKELTKITPAPKKNFAFRIKLLAGVYCILVALFGGWVIGNAVDIVQTNSQLYETVTETTAVNQNIISIISNINNLNNASGNPDDDTLLVKIITEEIDITPEEITEPNEYQVQSNWFDALCNGISNVFGG